MGLGAGVIVSPRRAVLPGGGGSAGTPRRAGPQLPGPDGAIEAKKALLRVLQWRQQQQQRARESEEQLQAAREQKRLEREREQSQRERRRVEIYAWNTLLKAIENARADAFLRGDLEQGQQHSV